MPSVMKSVLPAIRDILRQQQPALMGMGGDSTTSSPSNLSSLLLSFEFELDQSGKFSPLVQFVDRITAGRSGSEILFFFCIISAMVVFVVIVPAVEGYLQYLEERDYEEYKKEIFSSCTKTSKIKAKYSPQGVLEWVEEDWQLSMETIVEGTSEDEGSEDTDDDDCDEEEFESDSSPGARTLSSFSSSESVESNDNCFGDYDHDDFEGPQTPTPSSPPLSPERTHMPMMPVPIGEFMTFEMPGR